MATDDARLTVLEERFCHQAQVIEALNSALIEQQRALDLVTARLLRLEGLTLDHEQLTQAPADERPPHY